MKFTITAGHGAGDPGAVAKTGETEAALMTELREIVAEKLRQAGHTVKTDGARWQNLPLVHALTLVPGSDVAVELHTNSVADVRAKGVEVISLPAQKEMARTIARRIAHTLEIPVRGAGGWIDQSQSARGRLGFVRGFARYRQERNDRAKKNHHQDDQLDQREAAHGEAHCVHFHWNTAVLTKPVPAATVTVAISVLPTKIW